MVHTLGARAGDPHPPGRCARALPARAGRRHRSREEAARSSATCSSTSSRTRRRRCSGELHGVAFLAQGTLYPDVIESVSVKGPSAVIKTHHNVGGLPEELGFELIEPLRWLFKDEVRQLGRELGLPEEVLQRHPFPGPGPGGARARRDHRGAAGHAARGGLHLARGAARGGLVQQGGAGLRGAAAGQERRRDGRRADLRGRGRDPRRGDARLHDRRLGPLPYELLGRVASRIINEVPGVNRVVYDITSKPPATIEWE